MDTDALTNLADHLTRHGLTVARCEPEQRIHVTNPISSLLSEEITLRSGRYYTGFDYEIGERGRERDCAERIARMLVAAGAAT